MSPESQPAKNNHSANRSALVNKVLATVGGALILGLQGVNLTEVTGMQDLMKRADEAIRKQSELIEQINKKDQHIETALQKQDVIIANQEAIIEKLENK